MVESAEETRNRLVSPLEAAGRGKKTREEPCETHLVAAGYVVSRW